MGRIQTTLFLSYTALFFIILIPFIQLFYSLTNINNQYSQAVNGLLIIETLPEDVDDLISNFQSIIQDIDNEKLHENYVENHNNIKSKLNHIEESVDSNSLVSFQGLKKSTEKILTLSEEGVRYAKEGEYVESVEKYDEIVKRNAFITGNTNVLIANRLKDIESFQVQMIQNRISTLSVTAVIFVSSTVIYFFLTIFLSKKVVEPLNILSAISKKVAEGNFSVKIPESLLKRNDEHGDFAKAFKNMFEEIKKQLLSIKKAQGELEQKNKELERLNDAMIGRELKMIELKKELKKYKKT